MLTILSKKTWRTCDFPVWERVKHIVPVYNAHTSYQIKNLGKILNTVLFLMILIYFLLCLIYLPTFLCILADSKKHTKYKRNFEDILNRTKDISVSQWFITLHLYVSDCTVHLRYDVINCILSITWCYICDIIKTVYYLLHDATSVT